MGEPTTDSTTDDSWALTLVENIQSRIYMVKNPSKIGNPTYRATSVVSWLIVSIPSGKMIIMAVPINIPILRKDKYFKWCWATVNFKGSIPATKVATNITSGSAINTKVIL